MAVGEPPPPSGGGGMANPPVPPENAAPGGGQNNNSNSSNNNGGGGGPPPATLRLWQEVRNGIDKHQTVIWRNAVDSLSAALKYLPTTTSEGSSSSSSEARKFIEEYMKPIISILLEQHPSKIGSNERNCVEESLRLGVQIVVKDLTLRTSELVDQEKEEGASLSREAKGGVAAMADEAADAEEGEEESVDPMATADDDRDGKPPTGEDDDADDGVGKQQHGVSGVCQTLETLAYIFDRRKIFYKGSKSSGGNWNQQSMGGGGHGMPDVRVQMIGKFRREGGFGVLTDYLTCLLRVDAAVRKGEKKREEERAAAAAAMQGGSRGGGSEGGEPTSATSGGGEEKEEEDKTPAKAQPQPRAARDDEPAPFPSLEIVHRILGAALDVMPPPPPSGKQQQPPENNSSSSSLAKSHAAKSADLESWDSDTISLTRPLMKFLSTAPDAYLKANAPSDLDIIRSDLQRIYDRVTYRNRRATSRFYQFWTDLVWRLITSSSLPLKLFGWEEVDACLKAGIALRPPPRSFLVSGAGCDLVNGRYEYAGPVDEDGFAVLGGGGNSNSGAGELKYERVILPPSASATDAAGSAGAAAPDGAGDGPPPPSAAKAKSKTLTLFRCTMRSQQKWWFLSEADEDQPGTDKDIDYYQHKSRGALEESQPPPVGWVTCRNAGIDPPPTLTPLGVMVPQDQIYDTLEHRLARWAIENSVIELVLGDSVHREIVSRSTGLVTFLATMCSRDGPYAFPKDEETQGRRGENPSGPNRYCLRPSHLLLAWKTCTSKADAAVSAEVYRLLVTILPTLPSSLATRLLKAVHDSLRAGVGGGGSGVGGGSSTGGVGATTTKDKRKYLPEVAEFCGALATAYPVVDGGVVDGTSGSAAAAASSPGNKAGAAAAASAAAQSSSSIHSISPVVRAEILQLLWSVLMHPDSSTRTLKNYDLLKEYVRNELRFHPKYRMEFLESCRRNLDFYAGTSCSSRSSSGGGAFSSDAERVSSGGSVASREDPSAAQQVVNEGVALRTVKLTRFVLEACPRDEALGLVTERDAALPLLLLRELSAYLQRRRRTHSAETVRPSVITTQLSTKSSSVVSASAPDSNHAMALSERLHIIRYAYGLSDRAVITSQQLNHLWDLCGGEPEDQEALMIFVASSASGGGGGESDANAHVAGQGVAATEGGGSATRAAQQQQQQPSSLVPRGQAATASAPPPLTNQTSTAQLNPKQSLRSAFTDDVRVYAFRTLFCSLSIDWEDLGTGAYQSFQLLFQSLQRAPLTTSNGPALDALWRICLTAGRDDVASQARRDLLAVYTATVGARQNEEQHQLARADRPMEMDEPAGVVSTTAAAVTAAPMFDSAAEDDQLAQEEGDSFSKRVFDCLARVRQGLETNEPSSERSAERCLRILSAALGNGEERRASSSAAACLGSISSATTVPDALREIPHGLRGRGSYLTIGVHAKRLTPNAASSSSASAPALPSASSVATPPPATVRFALDVHPLETLASVKAKVARHCNHRVDLVKPISVNGGRAVAAATATSGNSKRGDGQQMNLNQEPDSTLVTDLGVTAGCEVVFLLAINPLPAPAAGGSSAAKAASSKDGDLGRIFASGGDGSAAAQDGLFEMLLNVLEALPSRSGTGTGPVSSSNETFDSYELVWNILRSMPTDESVVERVERAAVGRGDADARGGGGARDWSAVLDRNRYHRSVYAMQVIDSYLQPAPELFSSLEANEGGDKARTLQAEMARGAVQFRQGFVRGGGFDAVMSFFTEADRGQRVGSGDRRRKTEMGNTIALRVLKCCLFGNSASGTAAAFGSDGSSASTFSSPLDDLGQRLLRSIPSPKNFLEGLTSRMIADPDEVTDAALLDALQLLRLMLTSNAHTTKLFVSLPNGVAENFLVTLLLWERRSGSGTVVALASVDLSSRIRRGAEDLILTIPALSRCVLPWLIKAIDRVDSNSDCTEEFFDVLRMLVEGRYGSSQIDASSRPSAGQLRDLGTAVCKKIATHPQGQAGDIGGAAINFSGGVLCGCLRLLRALVESGGGSALGEGVGLLTDAFQTRPWSQLLNGPLGGRDDDDALIDLMGAMFDGYLSNAESSSSSSSSPLSSCDRESRRLGFDVITAAASSCSGGDGYLVLVERIGRIISAAAPSLRHRWGHNVPTEEGRNATPRNTALTANTSNFTGLRNQGCTCYMNSVLQQLFMMPGLRENLCSAALPSSLRSCGVGSVAKGADLIGKVISVHWENGTSYEARVEEFDSVSGMHTVRYSPLLLPTGGGGHHGQNHHQPPQFHPDEAALLPDEMLEEFFLHEGRPGKESGVFDVVPTDNMDVSDGDERPGGVGTGESSREEGRGVRRSSTTSGIQEKEEEASCRRLLEETQRTLVHLAEGLHGRCFDPRSLVEASACLKLEFDVWQQNDASEFAMKLLDRLEVPLKRWSPQHFKYLENTFGLKQTKQKICKKCGLKTNREEHFMNIDCQIRGKSDIHEALSTLCEVEFMEGDNKVFCDRCKEKCDTVLRTAISRLPNTLVLSLKRFDLDYNTFETVKLNSRCSFGQTLNMKRYTLEGVERMEKANENEKGEGADSMVDSNHSDSEGGASDPLSSLPDEDYEYKLAGVLVHAGVAQGGHYYSFIRDRTSTSGKNGDKWYRFDDEDVTPFDSSQIEVECFGGKVKKETKFPNGQVHTVESEQFANALMLFYEKVKPSDNHENDNANKDGDGSKDVPMDEQEDDAKQVVQTSSGYDVFQQDVQRSNKTHSWLDFLFDAEFQDLLKGLVDSCLLSSSNVPNIEAMDVSTPLSMSPPHAQDKDGGSSPWRLALLQLLLSYVFDVLLHSTDKGALSAWAEKLVGALNENKDGAKSFVHELASRTGMVSANWLRTYCSDCPEKASREAAIQIFVSGIQSGASFSSEQEALEKWAQAWSSQVLERERHMKERRERVQMPTMLQGLYRALEDVNKFENGSSSLGVIISFLTHLLEVAPRTLRYNADLCLLIRDMACLKAEGGAQIVRDAMIEAEIPARLVCLAVRDQVHNPALRVAFPGSSQRYEVAEAMTKTETVASSHLMPLAGGAVGAGGVGGNASVPGPSDCLSLFEALGCMMGAQFVRASPVVKDTGGRLPELSDELTETLTIMFKEMMTPNIGMGQNDIIKYLKVCGHDVSVSNVALSQRITNILAKYPTISGVEGGRDARFLTLDGFLAYHRDTVQTNDAQQVRADLVAFGFRPDFTRISEEHRIYLSGDRRRKYQIAESIAFDATSQRKNGAPILLGNLAEPALQCFSLYHLAYNCSDNVGTYLLACFSYGRDMNTLISECLKALSHAPAGWGGNELVSACLMIMKILAAVPDERQQERITRIMQNVERASQHHSSPGMGLLVAAKEIFRSSRHSQQYQTGAFERYVDIVKELQKQREVRRWLSEHQAAWSWMEQWLQPEVRVAPQQHHRNAGANIQSIPIGHNHSDSDMNTGLHDSEDDESPFDQEEEGRLLVVQGAGTQGVNGTYHHHEYFDEANRYTKSGVYDGREVTFSIFRCRLSDNTRRWYISIVPKSILPGTNKDIDFYSAPSHDNSHFPPENMWSTVNGGTGNNPPPILAFKVDPGPDANDDVNGGQIWNGDGGDDAMDDDVVDGQENGYL